MGEWWNGRHKGLKIPRSLYECEGSNPSSPIVLIAFPFLFDAGWSSLEARWAHNPKVVGSNPTPATNFIQIN